MFQAGLRLLLILFASALSFPATANNGLNLVGFGSESLNMGGADVAVARDTTALNTNPAGLPLAVQKRKGAFDIYGTVSIARDVAHKDGLGNDTEVSGKLTPTGGGGLAMQVPDSAFTLGVGIFVQGGAGNEFENLKTVFGTRDELSTQLGIGKISPGIAYQVNEELRVGLVVAAVLGRLEQKILPGTSFFNALNPPASFFGFNAKNLTATGINPRIGIQYDVSPRWTLGGVYSPKTKLDFEHGSLQSNQSAIGLGIVNYSDARIEGFALPQEVGLGSAWKAASGSTLVSLKLAWLNWGSALNGQTLIASNPDKPGAPASITRTTRLDWKDQYVAAIGIAHDIDDAITVYGGFNYANNPVPAENLSPLLSPAIAQKHLTAGASYKFENKSKISGGVLYVLPEKVKYSNNSFPVFGANTQERIEYLGFNLMWSTTW